MLAIGPFPASSVSLLARLWIEILLYSYYNTSFSRQPPCEAVNWNFSGLSVAATERVSLLARLWIEIHIRTMYQPFARSASLRGCELKCVGIPHYAESWRQPPCEAVNWNAYFANTTAAFKVSLLARLWIEILLPFNFLMYLPVSLLARLWIEMGSPFPM